MSMHHLSSRCPREPGKMRIRVEAELGQLGGVEEDVKVDESSARHMPRWLERPEQQLRAGMDITCMCRSAIATRKRKDPKGDLWHSVIESTGQSPEFR
jgi:hypothetical protein